MLNIKIFSTSASSAVYENQANRLAKEVAKYKGEHAGATEQWLQSSAGEEPTGIEITLTAIVTYDDVQVPPPFG